MAKKVDPLAKVIHDLCVAAGVKCEQRGCKAPSVSVKPARPGRRNLRLAEAEALARAG